MSTPKVLVIAGPTATGKTLLGVQVAKAVGGEVVSADAMQVYKYMDIGTAKPTPDEMDNIPHYMINTALPWEDYSVARYVREAQVHVDDILSRGKLPIIVGGSGLYIDSLLAGRTFTARADEDLRKTLEARYDSIGGENMLEELKALDCERAEKLFPNDKKRIVRAFEAIEMSGKPLSEHDTQSKTQPPKYDGIKFVLTFNDRAVLYSRIDNRVDLMIENGLLQEVQSLIDMGAGRSGTSMKAIGYKELVDAAHGEITQEAAVDKIKRESRRYAKRQLTWFRRDKNASWLTWDKTPDINFGAEKITGIINETK
ncbi:MAG: tRNA (adenosine(37)-N6)-dimethylallyltransferase MiaA [Oscillospiraceae bacterium]|nr:tRNA (adenosine(37)-N6)-dimethylallyltransferase MiaA [Oscillospiraceae bacterium]